jgi:hypothetical protein
MAAKNHARITGKSQAFFKRRERNGQLGRRQKHGSIDSLLGASNWNG